MSRIKTNRHIAAALLKTISALDADPSLDPHEPAFVHLKCTLLQRLMSLEVDTAEIKSSLHLIEETEFPDSVHAAAEVDAAIA